MHVIQPHLYDAQLAVKKEQLKKMFGSLYEHDPETFASPVSHYRMRAEFRLWYQEQQMHYVMFEKGTNNKPVFITEFPQAHRSIADLMFPLLEAINKIPLIAVRLFQINFLATQAGEVLVSLIYHKNLSDDWEAAAKLLQAQFNIHIIGRAHKQKRVLSEEYVTESLNFFNKVYHYKQYENCFSQPNAKICEKMVEWILAQLKPQESANDLLELYCGNGNFTLPLASMFNKVLATEVSKLSIKAAKENAALNAIANIQFCRLSSHEITQALSGEREFRRLAEINLADYSFSTIFVDPPRAGLDPETLKFVEKFECILYISCNPQTLKDNILQLKQHAVTNLALFDQFPYTEHIECGAILEKR